MKPCNHDCREIAEKLIPPLRERARELGYALAVHGTLKRDIDLLAVPWVAEAAEPKALALALYETTVRINGCAYLQHDPLHDDGCPGHKPHGRLVWSFYFAMGDDGYPSAREGYVDLSVMSKRPEA